MPGPEHKERDSDAADDLIFDSGFELNLTELSYKAFDARIPRLFVRFLNVIDAKLVIRCGSILPLIGNDPEKIDGNTEFLSSSGPVKWSAITGNAGIQLLLKDNTTTPFRLVRRKNASNMSGGIFTPNQLACGLSQYVVIAMAMESLVGDDNQDLLLRFFTTSLPMAAGIRHRHIQACLELSAKITLNGKDKTLSSRPKTYTEWKTRFIGVYDSAMREHGLTSNIIKKVVASAPAFFAQTEVKPPTCVTIVEDLMDGALKEYKTSLEKEFGASDDDIIVKFLKEMRKK